MKAFVSARPGPVARLSVSEIEIPSVADDGVLVRVRASSANPVDLFPTTTAGHLAAGRRPRVLGTDFAGIVDAVGKDVTRFRPGDEVFGGKPGAFADFLAIPETGAIAQKPAGVPFEFAGTVAVAATTALQALRDHGGVRAGQRVLVNGASGGVGTFTVQIARALGADVTAVCSTRNVELVRTIGANTVIDYTKEDFTRRSDRHDVIIDVAAGHSFSSCRRVLEPGGAFVGVGAAAVMHRRASTPRAFGHFLGTRIRSIGRGYRVVSLFIANLNQRDMELLASLLASGRVVPAIDRRYDLAGVSQALQYINEGHARAKVAIRVGSDE